MAYLLVLLALVGCMALLDARFRLFFWARPLAATLVTVLGLGYFIAWDLFAIAAGIFLHGESPLMTGIMLGPELPLEEPVFLLFLIYQTMVLFTGAQSWFRRKPSRHAEAPAAGAAPSREDAR